VYKFPPYHGLFRWTSRHDVDITDQARSLAEASRRIEALEKQLAELRSYCGAIYWLNVHIGYPMKRGTITLEVVHHAEFMALVYPQSDPGQ